MSLLQLDIQSVMSGNVTYVVNIKIKKKSIFEILRTYILRFIKLYKTVMNVYAIFTACQFCNLVAPSSGHIEMAFISESQ